MHVLLQSGLILWVPRRSYRKPSRERTRLVCELLLYKLRSSRAGPRARRCRSCWRIHLKDCRLQFFRAQSCALQSQNSIFFCYKFGCSTRLCASVHWQVGLSHMKRNFSVTESNIWINHHMEPLRWTWSQTPELFCCHKSCAGSFFRMRKRHSYQAKSCPLFTVQFLVESHAESQKLFRINQFMGTWLINRDLQSHYLMLPLMCREVSSHASSTKSGSKPWWTTHKRSSQARRKSKLLKPPLHNGRKNLACSSRNVTIFLANKESQNADAAKGNSGLHSFVAMLHFIIRPRYTDKEYKNISKVSGSIALYYFLSVKMILLMQQTSGGDACSGRW